jgi:hypothetical protein
MTGKCEVVDAVVPTVLPGDDVIDMVGEFAVFLVDMAIFAAVLRTPADEFARARIHR